MSEWVPTPYAQLPKVAAAWTDRVARSLTIVQLEGGTTSAWLPNAEQLAVWEAGMHSQRRYITKSRRRGVSTALRLEGMLWALNCDSLGHRVRYGIVMHVHDKLLEQFVQMQWWLKGRGQLGATAHCLDESITFPNGSEIFGVTASGQGASRSEGAQRMDYEEYAFYPPGAVGEISPSVSIGTQETIATTIDIGAPNGKRAQEMWRDTTNSFQKIFFPFEMAREYRADPNSINEQQWSWAQENGFKDPACAAYWLREILPNKCEGDLIRAFREYPPTADHMFRASETRWVRTTPRVLDPVDRVKVLGVTEEWCLDIYEKPENADIDTWVSVDTATGKGQDRSVVMVIGHVSRRILACFASDTVLGDDIAAVVAKAYALYSREIPEPTTGGTRWVRPRVIVEDNGIGNIVIQPLGRIGIPHEAFNTDEASKLQGLSEAKRGIESGQLEGPKELAQESDELHRNEHGRFVGHKDLMMACGFALRRIVISPPVQTVKQDLKREDRVDGRAMLRNQMRRERMGMR